MFYLIVSVTMRRTILVVLSFIFITSCIAQSGQNDLNELKIGVLRHAPPGIAEKKLIEIANRRGHKIELVNPLNLTLETKGLEGYDVIISRAEIDSFTDNITDAYLRALEYFACLKIPVINSANSTLDAQDKFRTLLLAEQAGVSIPETFLVHDAEQIQRLLDTCKIQYPFVVKGLYGGCGESVFLVQDSLALYKKLYSNFRIGDPILIQERINLETNDSGNFRDMRIWVVRDPSTNKAKFVGGAYRNAQNGNFLTNISAKGSITPMESYDQDVIELSEKALEAINADVAGIDLARDIDGNLFLLEVNISFHTSQDTEDAIGVNIWELVMDLAQARTKACYAN